MLFQGRRLKRFAQGMVGLGAIAFAAPAGAAIISATVVSQSGAPMGQQQIHVENHISGDSFLTTTGADGRFSVDVPPGYYDVRNDTGAVLYPNVVATHLAAVQLGRITAGSAFRAFFQQERIAPGIVTSPAPITAYVIPGSHYIRQILPPALQR